MKSFVSIFIGVLFLLSCQHVNKEEREKQAVELAIEIKSLASPTNNSIRGICAVSTNIIWLSGAKGSILRTLNGGEKWEKLPLPDNDSLDFRDVEAFSADEAIIVSAGFPSRVYRTTNGGVHWELIHENKDSSSFMNSIAFNNKNEGIILGDQLDGRHLILHSQDRGVSWTRVDSTNVPVPLPIENGFAASGSCIAINQDGHFFIGLGGEKTRVFYSQDGVNWDAQITPMVSGKGGASGIYSIASGGKSIIGVGGNYSLPDSTYHPIVSMNNGATWQKTLGKVWGYRSIIDYSIYNNIWVCGGSNGLDYSIDGGNTWVNFSKKSINTLQFLPNSKKAIAANGKGEIFVLEFQTTI